MHIKRQRRRVEGQHKGFDSKGQHQGFDIKGHLLIISLTVSCLVGLCLGLYLKNTWPDDIEEVGFFIKIPADIMMRLLRMLVVPIVVCSILNGVITFSGNRLGKILLAAVLFHGVTAILAILASVAAMTLAEAFEVIEDNSDEYDEVTSHYSGGSALALTDLISQMFPTNLVEACFYSVTNKEVFTRGTDVIDGNTNTTSEVYTKPVLFRRRSANLLGLVVASLLAGYLINRMDDKARTVKKFIVALNGALKIFMRVVIWYTPVGMMFMIALRLMDLNVYKTTSLIGNFVVIVLGIQIFHMLGSLCVIYFCITRKNPLTFLSLVSPALLTAWATDSSCIALPESLKCLVEEAKLDVSIVHFMMPLSATINFDGTMLHEVAVCFMIILSYGFILRGLDVVIICLTAAVTTATSNTIPQSGMLSTLWILHTMGLPTDDVLLLMSADWLMNRFRTVTNVWGDCVGTAILHHYYKTEAVEVVKPPMLPKKSAISYREKDEDLYAKRRSMQSTASFESSYSFDEDRYSLSL